MLVKIVEYIIYLKIIRHFFEMLLVARKSIVRTIFYLGLNRLGYCHFSIDNTDSFVVGLINIFGDI
ncbi:hypothetical protein GCM10025884_09100 [Leuconostoc gelidum subsp. gelidum]|nr:hypothetical protein GCM10025884_09100 [Leuconostoc gelidum subsp. gelidum]